MKRRKILYSISEIAQAQLLDLMHAYAICYLLHFGQRLGNLSNPRAQAQHYLGWTTDLDKRIYTHATNYQLSGAIVWHAFNTYQTSVMVARVWEGDYVIERLLKNLKCGPQLCPTCNPTGWHLIGNPYGTVPLPDVEISTKMDGYEFWHTVGKKHSKKYAPPPPVLPDTWDGDDL